MAQRAVSTAYFPLAGGFDGFVHIGFGQSYGFGEGIALPEEGCDGGRERTAGAMQIACVDAGTAEMVCLSVEEDVRHAVTFQMATFQ